MTVALQPVASDPWWERFFDEDFAALWLHDDDPAEQRRRTEGLLRVLELGAGQWLFDQCCGVGRVAVPLVARGVNLLAVDSAAAYVDRARARCEALPPATRGSFHIALGDAFTYAPTRLCDAAINWYTSFGYVHDDTRNLRMLRAAYGALQPLGRFALDYPDMERVRAEFRPLTERRRETADGTFVALREARSRGSERSGRSGRSERGRSTLGAGVLGWSTCCTTGAAITPTSSEADASAFTEASTSAAGLGGEVGAAPRCSCGSGAGALGRSESPAATTSSAVVTAATMSSVRRERGDSDATGVTCGASSMGGGP